MLHRTVDVSSVRSSPGESLAVEGEASLERLVVGPVEYAFVEPPRFSITVTNAGDGVVASGTVSARARVPCARCLEPFDIDLSGAVETFYVEPGHETGIPEEQDTEALESDEIVLAPLLEAALAVQAPFAPVHAEDCKGICPHCGTDLNDSACDCADADTGSPFEALRPLLEEDEDGEEA